MKNSNLISTLIGALFGISLYILMFFIPVSMMNPAIETLFRIIYSPIYIVALVDKVIFWIADITNSNIDRGLGMDGGPLEWVEYTAIAISMTICYGLIFLIGSLIIKRLKNIS